MPFRFRRPTPDDARMLLDWRTDPAISRHMFTDFAPDLERQRAWLAARAARPDFRHFVIACARENRPIGYLAYADIDGVQRRCSSGSYIAAEADRRRLAGYLYNFILDYCFHGLGMHKLVNQFLAGNEGVIRIQRRLKFREVGVLREHIHKGGHWHDVVVFEMLAREWDARKHPFPLERTLAAFEEA